MPLGVLVHVDTNVPQILDRLRGMPDEVIRELTLEVNRIQLDVLRDSKEVAPRVPVDTGALQSTGHVEPARIDNGVIHSMLTYGGASGFGFVDYAIPVHENMNARYKRPGAGPKFVEAHYRRRQQEIPQRLDAAIQRGIRR